MTVCQFFYTAWKSSAMKEKICNRTAALDINYCIIYWKGSAMFYVSCLKGSGEWLSWAAQRPQSVLTEVWLCGCNILVKGGIYKSWRWRGIKLNAPLLHWTSPRILNLWQIQDIFRRKNKHKHQTVGSPEGLNRDTDNFTLFYKELFSCLCIPCWCVNVLFSALEHPIK